MNRNTTLATTTFRSATVILPVINETYSLQETVRVIQETCNSQDIAEYLIVVSQRTTLESIGVCRRIQATLGEKCGIHRQTRPFIGGAMRDAFELAIGSHVIMMSTDLETDPNLVKIFIDKAKEDPNAIITASRWIKGGRFVGYNRAKLVSNYIFQRMLSLLFGTELTDLTYAYRIFPTNVVRAIDWQELKHPFFLETIIKPLRLGVRSVEIPAVWRTRTEGESQNPFLSNFAYFNIAIRTKFQPAERFLRDG